MQLSSLQLEAFYCLAQMRHFTKASERLHITQSALSQRILNLEAELETTLFIRDRMGVKLTESGLELLRYCRMQNGLEVEFLSQFQLKNPSALAGQLRIAGFSTVMHSVIMPPLAPLLLAHQEVRLSLLVRELQELPTLLKNGEADFIVLDHLPNMHGIATVYLGEEHYVLVERKKSALLSRVPDVYLDHDENDQTTLQYVKRYKKQSLKIKRHYLDDINGILTGVENGLGKAIVPRHLLQSFPNIKIIDHKKTLSFPVTLNYYEQPYYSKLHLTVVKTLLTACPMLLH